MPRTTLDIDTTVLRQLKERGRERGRTLGELASELLAEALAREPSEPRPLRWSSRPMGALIDLEDAEAVRRATEPE